MYDTNNIRFETKSYENKNSEQHELPFKPAKELALNGKNKSAVYSLQDIRIKKHDTIEDFSLDNKGKC